MFFYSAESIIAQLEANNTLICEGIKEIGCPSPAPFSVTHEKRGCVGDPSVCNECTNHECYQWVIVRNNDYIKLGMLMFKFVFSTYPRGRIPKDDSHFLRIKKHIPIDESKLEIC